MEVTIDIDDDVEAMLKEMLSADPHRSREQLINELLRTGLESIDSLEDTIK